MRRSSSRVAKSPPFDLRTVIDLPKAADRTSPVTLVSARSALAKEKPDVVVEWAGRLERVMSWIGRKLDKSVDSFMGAIGAAGGVAVVGGVSAQLAEVPVGEKISQVMGATLEWLHTVTLPF